MLYIWRHSMLFWTTQLHQHGRPLALLEALFSGAAEWWFKMLLTLVCSKCLLQMKERTQETSHMVQCIFSLSTHAVLNTLRGSC